MRGNHEAALQHSFGAGLDLQSFIVPTWLQVRATPNCIHKYVFNVLSLIYLNIHQGHRKYPHSYLYP